MIQRLSLLFVACVLLFSACGPISEKAKLNYMQAFHEGHLEKAEDVLKKEGSSASYQKNRNALWFLLEKGSLNLINNQVDASIKYFQKALEASDYFLQEDTGEKVQKVLLSDELSAFQGDDFEQILLRLYFAFALLQKGDTSNGLALLKQTESYEALKEGIYQKSQLTESLKLLPNPLSKYLLALFLERQGDTSNAKILYRQAKEKLPYPDVQNLNQLFPVTTSKKSGTLLVICHNGNSPYRISSNSKISEQALFLMNILLKGTGVIDPAFSSIPMIPVPKLMEWPNGSPISTEVSVGGKSKTLIPIFSVNQTAKKQLEQALPLITARAAARYLIREFTVQAAKKNDANLGVILDIGAFFANIMTKADTRTWMTLPYSFDIMRFELAPGIYPINVTVHDLVEPKYYQLPKIKIHENDICLVHLFNIHPNIFRHLVPESFISKEKKNEKN